MSISLISSFGPKSRVPYTMTYAVTMVTAAELQVCIQVWSQSRELISK